MSDIQAGLFAGLGIYAIAVTLGLLRATKLLAHMTMVADIMRETVHHMLFTPGHYEHMRRKAHEFVAEQQKEEQQAAKN